MGLVILSVTTLKDSVSNAEKWVRRNLGCGIDHLIVVVDGPQPELEAMLGAHPHATVVRGDAEWYADAPSELLNDRQIVNAALTCRLLAGLPWAEWVFHLDGDEVALVDRADLAALGADCRAVRLSTLEAVGTLHPVGDPTSFKRRLGANELKLLTMLGAIPEPSNAVYFRGHRFGKPGVRPSLDHAIGVHHVIDREGNQVEPALAPGLRLLHYESFSGDEFVRKWSALLGSGGHLGQRGQRRSVAGSIRTLLGLGLGEAETRAFLYRLYERLCEDDVGLLERLGVLVEVDPDSRRREVASSAEGVDQLRRLLTAARDLPKRPFLPKAFSPEADAMVTRLQSGS